MAYMQVLYPISLAYSLVISAYTLNFVRVVTKRTSLIYNYGHLITGN